MAPSATDAKSPTARRTRGLIVQMLAMVLALFVLEQDGELLAQDLHILPGAGALGGAFQMTPDFATGFVMASDVQPGGPLAQAGVASGDHLRFDRAFDYLRPAFAGEQRAFTLDHLGARSRHVAVAEPDATPARYTGQDAKQIFFALTCLIVSAFGAYMVLRSHGRRTVLCLGLGLLTYGLAFFYPELWEAWPATFPAFTTALLIVVFPLQTYAFQTFALDFTEETEGVHRSWARRWVWAYAAFCAIIAASYAYTSLTASKLPVVGDATQALGMVVYPPYLYTAFVMFDGWRRSGRETQQRYGMLLIALAMVIGSQVVQSTEYFLFGGAVWEFQDNGPVLISQVFAGVVAPVLFTYAIFRNKVFDLGFALNRTLVYGAVSAILLVAFGVIEWAVDHVVKIEGREKNALIDGAIALGVFLTFHRVRDFVEHHIETVFFRSWRDNEDRLRRFVGDAGHMLKADALVKAYVAELARFGAGAQAALYERTAAGGFARRAGALDGVPARLDPDVAELVRLRADRKSIEPDGEAALPAALILPMTHRNEITGVALLGYPPAGQAFRPDETEVLAWATAQIGHDLYALRVEELDNLSQAQKAEIALLKARNDELRRLGGAAPA